MSDGQRLFEAVRKNAEGSPYVVEETDYGFRVSLDIVDARWWGMLARSGVKKVATHDVRVDEARRTFAITDTLRRLEWSGGVSLQDGMVPRLSRTAEIQMGRIHRREVEKAWALDDSGSFGRIVDYSFDSSEGRDLIRGPAAALGWQERMPRSARIGLIVGVLGGLIAIFAPLAALIAALPGGF